MARHTKTMFERDTKGENPLIRSSANTSAVYKSLENIEMIKASTKKKKRNTTGLAQSCYIRNENAVSVLQNNIANGKTVIGTRKDTSKIQNLAALLGDKSAFD